MTSSSTSPRRSSATSPGSARRLQRWRRTGRERTPVWISRALMLCALYSLLGVFLWDLKAYEYLGLALLMLALPVGPSVFLAVILLVLTGPIRRRFRAAHTALLVIMVLDSLSSIAALVASVVTEDYRTWGNLPLVSATAVANLACTAFVLWCRPAFMVRMRGRAMRDAALALVLGMVLAWLITFGLVNAIGPNQYGGGDRARWSLAATLGAVGEPGTPPAGPHWLGVVGGLLSAAAVVGALVLLWRSERHSAFLSADDELAVRAMVLKHGEDDSLAYFATRRDKGVVLSPDRQAAIAFRAQGNVSVASGDPIGDPESWPAAVDAWLADTREHGRYAAVLSVGSEAAQLYTRRGLRALTLGDEAIIDTDRFQLSGRAMRPVRQAVNRVERAGYTADVRRHSELTREELAEVEQLAEAWRGDEVERGFSMALGRLGDPADGRCVVVLARDPRGQIRGLLSFVPWGRRGVSLDLMRRSPEAENGVTEFMVAALAHSADQVGIRRISLNFAVFRRVFSDAEEVGAGPVTRISNAVLMFASRYYQLDTLYKSNEKYAPTWVPRMLCYDPTLTAPRAALAMGIAEGFVPVPVLPTMSGGHLDRLQAPRQDPTFVERVHELEHEMARPATPVHRMNEQQRVRIEKSRRMASEGRSGYPVAVSRDRSVADALHLLAQRQRTDDVAPRTPGLRTGQQVRVTGRVRALRDLGGVAFAVLEEDGHRIQALVDAAHTPADQVHDFQRFVDLGDLLAVTGELVTSRSGEPSVLVAQWQTAAKCLNPLPTMHAKLADDARTRQRVLDLITGDDSLDFLRRRALGVQALRAAFVEERFLEVETPMLQQVHGGASARPFITHINAYDMNLYLRIAPELFLKRLAVAGMGRIFEVGRNFRNEGADATHNPEFTAVEAYAAYSDYHEMRELTRRVILKVAEAVNGAPVARRPDGQGGYTEVDLTPEWPVVTIHEAVSRASGHELSAQSTLDEVRQVCREHDVAAPPEATAGHLVMELYEALVEKQTAFPTFYCDFPREVSPLARPHRTTPGLTEQWDLVGFGAELGCAYSELTDPIDQRERLTAQSLAAAAGDHEAMQLDEDFLDALAYGMPPTGGLGIGVDRVVMLLLGQSIRATLAFPFVRPR